MSPPDKGCVCGTPSQNLPGNFSPVGATAALNFALITPKMLFPREENIALDVESEEFHSCSKLGQLPELAYYYGCEQPSRECCINLHFAL